MNLSVSECRLWPKRIAYDLLFARKRLFTLGQQTSLSAWQGIEYVDICSPHVIGFATENA
jgi:hypothetical protein